MPKYISLLRGINVSGHKKIKMADLRELYESLSFENVSSYIQSGNVVFDSDSTNILEISTAIAEKIECEYQFAVPIITRTAQEFAELANNNPFVNVRHEDSSKLYLCFLATSPNSPKKADFSRWQNKDEELVIMNKHIYLFYPEGYGRSKLTNNILERELAVVATSRNWRTVQKLLALSKN